MFSPRVPWGPQSRPDDDDLTRAKRLEQLNRGYEDSPWLTFLVFFSGFLAAVPGSLAAVFGIGTALAGGTWWPYAVLLAVLVGVHACLRAVRYQRRHAKRSWEHSRNRRGPCARPRHDLRS